MARPASGARIVRWRGDFYLFYRDHAGGKYKRVACTVLKAFNDAQRQELVKQYKTRELTAQAEVLNRGGLLAYDSRLMEEIAEYKTNVDERARAREDNPDSRAGLSLASERAITDGLTHFENWLKQANLDGITTGRLDRPTLDRYFDHLARRPGRRGKTRIKRSASTLNHHRRILKACLNWIASRRPLRFPDFEAVKPALRPVHGNRRQPVAFSPAQLKEFFDEAIALEDPSRKSAVKRIRKGKEERFEQRPHLRALTPPSRLFILLALTGCRLGEALGMKWDDVDLERGRITINAPKTGRTRWLPLTGAPEGEIAPTLLEMLKEWKKEKPKRDHVLPHGDIEAPIFPKGSWAAVVDATGHAISPQKLRQNFTSYAASLGIPSSIAALWQGHAADVAERHYRAQVPDRVKAKSFEDAMGLNDALQFLKDSN